MLNVGFNYLLAQMNQLIFQKYRISLLFIKCWKLVDKVLKKLKLDIMQGIMTKIDIYFLRFSAEHL